MEIARAAVIANSPPKKSLIWISQKVLRSEYPVLGRLKQEIQVLHMTFTTTPRLKKLLIAAAVLGAFLPVWLFVITPRIFPKVACVIERPSGELVKAWGEADCLNNEQVVMVIRAD